MKRRGLLTLAAGLPAWPAPLRAQTAAAARPRIGVLSFGAAPSGTDPDPIAGFRDGLRELGHDEGRSLLIDYRYADGQAERLAALAAELVALKVDVIVAGGPAPLLAARNATRTLPIVAISGADPVREGWAQSLARPGGNVTGLTVTYPELGPKQLETLSQALPGLARVALLFARDEARTAGLAEAAQGLGLQLQLIEIGTLAGLDAAFERARQGRAQAVHAIATNTVVSHRSRLAALALQHRLPSISEIPVLADAGFLLSYGADLNALVRRAAGYVDRILKGARPAELAIERPSVLELVVNLKTARALGIRLAPALLQRAGRVIE